MDSGGRKLFTGKTKDGISLDREQFESDGRCQERQDRAIYKIYVLR